MKKIKNYMEIKTLSHATNLESVCNAISVFVMQLDPTSGDLADIKTAVNEAVNNAIIHAYPGEIGKISVCASIFEDNLVEIKVKDWGCGIKNIKQAREALFTTGKDKGYSGLGFSVMENFMDKVIVRSTIYKGTTVTMKKRIETKELQ